MENYKVNERLKRLEPIETLCQFCNENHSSKMDRNHFISIYNIQDRTNIIVYRSVKFNKILIGIPRCNNCYLIHKKSFFYGGVIGLITGVVLGYSGFEFLGPIGIFTLVPSIMLALISPLFIGDMLVKKKGILTKKQGIMKDHLIQELVIAGWTLNPPRA